MFNNYSYFPFQGVQPRPSLFSSLRNLHFGDILNGAQKTLNVVNQAIPVFYQIKPLWNNTKTIFKIANAINDDDKKNTQNTQSTNNKVNENKSANNSKEPITNKTNIQYNEPVFFL